MPRVLFMIARQTALLHQPAEAAFDHPAARQHDEVLLVCELLDDAQPKARAMAEEAAPSLHRLSPASTLLWTSPTSPRQRSFWKNNDIVWSEGIKEMHLVLKDDHNLHAHKRPDPEKFFPTKVRMTLIQVSKGAKYDPKLVPALH